MFSGHLDLKQRLWWAADDVLSREACQRYIERFEQGDPIIAPVIRRDGVGVDERVRNNRRVMWDDTADAGRVLAGTRQRVLHEYGAFPDTFQGGSLLCANPRLRVYRYAPGERHGVHWDTELAVEGGVSRVTLVVYLNDDFTGGATNFPELDVTVTPKTGRALMFQHRILHEACAVTRGSKYALRTDLVYQHTS
ncbi:MAG: 2OG-Fe(II) oxygenase [Proteobacteria bacterium]|nr:2OG-Fe(II) oxygenase [Pseudomonadota bacterium]